MAQHQSRANPMVSVIVANFNGERFVGEALRSVLAQTLDDIEIIVADDGSTDSSREIITGIAASDPRVHLLPVTPNMGVSAARNRCLGHAKGRWVAVFDSDDIMHPERLERLVHFAERDGVEIAADDLLIFHDGAEGAIESCLSGNMARTPHDVGLADYIRYNGIARGVMPFGYLKPLIRWAFLRGAGISYDSTLQVGEDYDLVARLLVRGARLRVYPELTYFYRKHTASVSHRLSAGALSALLSANERFRSILAEHGGDRSVARLLDAREAMLQRDLMFDHMITALKARRWSRIPLMIARHPASAVLLLRPVRARVRSVIGAVLRRRDTAKERAGVVVISRQRVVGKTTGSSAYLLNLLETFAHLGKAVHLICPSPVMFGRQPILWFRPEMRLFTTIHVRKSMRVGRFLIALDSVTWVRFLRAFAGQLLLRIRVNKAWFTQSAPYSIGAPWTREDFMHVARYARRLGDVIVADYAFLTDGIPYVLRPDATSFVVMHDLFSSRPDQFLRVGDNDGVATIELKAEMRALSQADVVIAIQPEEAAVVRSHVLGKPVLVLPIAVDPVPSPQPGTGREVLFIGSKAAPNVNGMRWFIANVWPVIFAAEPDACLLVCGGVGASLGFDHPGVEILGFADDLAPLYRRASVVISPLLVGSGLKIKLVEALGQGKAIVATSTTLQGVEEEARSAVLLADDEDAFAAAVIRLLRDEGLRMSLGIMALEAVRKRYTEAACHAPLVDFLARLKEQTVPGNQVVEEPDPVEV